MAVSFHLSEEAAAMATHSSVKVEAASLLDGGFYRRRWQLLLLAWVVKFPLSEVVAASAMDYDDFLFRGVKHITMLFTSCLACLALFRGLSWALRLSARRLST